jgi:hypothetical protein
MVSSLASSTFKADLNVFTDFEVTVELDNPFH